MLAKGIDGGLQTVATFIPVIGFLYLFLSVLEDSGYMARAAFVMDRFMRWVGLPGGKPIGSTAALARESSCQEPLGQPPSPGNPGAMHLQVGLA
jgi:hypothetical protein